MENIEQIEDMYIAIDIIKDMLQNGAHPPLTEHETAHLKKTLDALIDIRDNEYR